MYIQERAEIEKITCTFQKTFQYVLSLVRELELFVHFKQKLNN